MRLREHHRIETQRRSARPGFRYNTDRHRWEYCHANDIVWRATGSQDDLKWLRDTQRFPGLFAAYDDTWAEDTE